MRKLKGGSQRYGKCEICKKETDISYIKKVKNNVIVGHKECLERYENKYREK